MEREDDVRRMLADIEAEVALTRDLIGRTALDPRVMRSMAEVPRHRFVPDYLADRAYDNGPLPVGHGQTISQPFMVALMTDLLEVGPEATVLEVGTGSAYQAAVLSRLVRQVYSIEIVGDLARTARQRLSELGYTNVEVVEADGYNGLPEHAPFDGIIVTACGRHVPPPLIEQLKPGGRMVIPVGDPLYGQELEVLAKGEDGAIDTHRILGVAFVPLTRRQ